MSVSGPTGDCVARLRREFRLAIRVHVALHITVDIRFVAAHAFAKKFRRLAALVFDVAVQAVLPLVLPLAHLARPRLLLVRAVDHVDRLRNGRRRRRRRGRLALHRLEIRYTLR